ncbi:DUF4174 domain-containing protein [Agrobacterium rubi]|uniref:DUF4174 domain-containing protein n=1 Tax=Agrobacterium rubi TaxID=28099 RepID=UPI001573C5EA|nr:DUF4174 domain-containing protein [Agrobacterium rubi]NTF20637.1 DUF4174 domain-containing protein [Agrobacterium rubi]NTF27607.1 DUF4174 domain-containing protein [Agrobacterium rubi]
MKKLLLAAALLLAWNTQGWSMDSLSHLTWKNRVLVVFGKTEDAKVQKQIETVREQEAELADRDMVVLHVTDDRVTPIFGSAGGLDAKTLTREAGANGKAFEAVLIGKDGGIKLRSDDVVGSVALFDLIDRMPMRQAGQK